MPSRCTTVSTDLLALGGIVAPRPRSARADEVCLSKDMPGSSEIANGNHHRIIPSTAVVYLHPPIKVRPALTWPRGPGFRVGPWTVTGC